MEEYLFKTNKKVYNYKREDLECILAYYNMFLSLDDICKLLKSDKNVIQDKIASFYGDVLQEDEVHYVFVDWERNKADYYNLDVLFLLNDDNNKDLRDFLLWANRQLKAYLIKLQYEKENDFLSVLNTGMGNEISFTLPSTKNTIKKDIPNVYTHMNIGK